MKAPAGMLAGAVDLGGRAITNEIELLQFLADDCGAEGFTYDERAGRLHALRWREGFPYTVKSYDVTEVGQR